MGGTSDARTGRMEMKLLLCAWDPKMVSPWEVIPMGSEPAPQHHRATRPQRGQFWGRGSRERGCPAQRPPHTKNPFRVTGWQGSSQTFFKGLCTEYKSSSFIRAVTQTGPRPQDSDTEWGLPSASGQHSGITVGGAQIPSWWSHRSGASAPLIRSRAISVWCPSEKQFQVDQHDRCSQEHAA